MRGFCVMSEKSYSNIHSTNKFLTQIAVGDEIPVEND